MLALSSVCWLGDAPALEPAEVAIVFSSRDEHSVELALAYASARNIPAQNLIGIDLDTSRAILPAKRFARIGRSVAERLDEDIQALVLAWTLPYRVGCMSVTSAFALGFDARYCATGCAPTAPNPYFESSSRRPYADHGIRPAMLLAAPSVTAGRALVERGVASDYTQPPGTAYLVITDDRNRNTRTPRFAFARAL